MVNIKFYFIVLLTFCSLLVISCSNDTTSIKDKVEAQKSKNIFPFSDTYKVELFSYKSKDETDNSFSLLLRDHLNNPVQLKEVLKANKLNIKERVVLQKAQIVELGKILYLDECGDEITGNCTTARHAIIFYDNSDNPIAIAEISFDCITTILSSNFSKFNFCEAKGNKLKSFFQEVGITYFEEPVL